MKLRRVVPWTVLLSCLFLPPVASSVTPGLLDDFEDGTTQGWTVGSEGGPHPAPPANVPTDGPAGAEDNYLLLTAVARSPQDLTDPGVRLAAHNVDQWTGDYVAARIESIAMDLNNLGTTELSIRLLFSNADQPQPQRSSQVALSTDPVVLPPGSGWVRAVFPVTPGALTAQAGDVATALRNANDVRIFHSEIPVFPPPPVAASLGVDNIEAVALPPAPHISITDAVAAPDDGQVAFGPALAGTFSEQTVTVRNSGDAVLVLGAVTGQDPPFTVVSDGCSGRTLAPLETCSLVLRFEPTAAGSYSDSLAVASNDPAASVTAVALSGEASAPPSEAGGGGAGGGCFLTLADREAPGAAVLAAILLPLAALAYRFRWTVITR